MCSAEEDGIEDDFCDNTPFSTEANNQSAETCPGPSNMPSVQSRSTYEYVTNN